MKPRYIRSLKDLEDTLEWRKRELGLQVGYGFFATAMELVPPVPTAILMRYYHTQNSKVIENWRSKYIQFK